MGKVSEALLCGSIGVILAAGGMLFRISAVGGHSMEPALVAGDVCVSLAHAPIARGDIVLYALPGHGAVLHRVVAVGSGGELRTRGDANPVADREAVPASHVRGKVVAVLPLGRAARGWLRAVRGATLLTQSQ